VLFVDEGLHFGWVLVYAETTVFCLGLKRKKKESGSLAFLDREVVPCRSRCDVVAKTDRCARAGE
jgi:hypothetical protein